MNFKYKIFLLLLIPFALYAKSSAQIQVEIHIYPDSSIKMEEPKLPKNTIVSGFGGVTFLKEEIVPELLLDLKTIGEFSKQGKKVYIFKNCINAFHTTSSAEITLESPHSKDHWYFYNKEEKLISLQKTRKLGVKNKQYYVICSAKDGKNPSPATLTLINKIV